MRFDPAAADLVQPDLCVVDPVTSRVLVPAAALGEAMDHIDRLEREVTELRERLFDAELALQRDREQPWWAWWRRGGVHPFGG